MLAKGHSYYKRIYGEVYVIRVFILQANDGHHKQAKQNRSEGNAPKLL